MSDDQKQRMFSALRLFTPTGLIGLLFMCGMIYQQFVAMSIKLDSLVTKLEAVATEQARRGPIIDDLRDFRNNYMRYHYEYEQPKTKH